MGFDQYHEPPEEFSEETRTYVRVIQSLIEEAEAIDWYAQRLAVEKDEEARAVMSRAQKEEFIHFGIDLEFLLRRTPVWRNILKTFCSKRAISSSWRRKPKRQSMRTKQGGLAAKNPGMGDGPAPRIKVVTLPA